MPHDPSPDRRIAPPPPVPPPFACSRREETRSASVHPVFELTGGVEPADRTVTAETTHAGA